MPGTTALPAATNWFQDAFGFRQILAKSSEDDSKFARERRDMSSYELTRDQFDLNGTTLSSKANGKKFEVGTFEVASLDRLRRSCSEGSLTAADEFMLAGDLSFENIIEDIMDLYEDDENAGAVFQVSSLFNCLETVSGYKPEDGVEKYGGQPFQGPVSACCCPAATVFRNYFVNGAGQAGDNQLDCLSEVGEFIENEKNNHWMMRHGYCAPYRTGSICDLSNKIAADARVADGVVGKVQIGLHWDTEVWTGTHRVCQAFCSALPVALYKSAASSSDWHGFAQAVLDAAYDATLTAAVILAQQRGERVKVFLTAVGGGQLGNRRNWIAEAINKALIAHRKEPLDVFMVHHAEIPLTYDDLERGRKHCEVRRMKKTSSHHAKMLSEEASRYRSEEILVPGDPEGETLKKLGVMFAHYDLNGDGFIDQRELEALLHHVDGTFFTPAVIKKLMHDADADGDDCIHYTEFVSWIFDDRDLTHLFLDAANRVSVSQLQQQRSNNIAARKVRSRR